MSAIPNLPTDVSRLHANGEAKPSFKLNDAPVENLRRLKVIVIGAGYSGIYCGIRIPERLRNVDLVIYEKNAGVGGTWYENRFVDWFEMAIRSASMPITNADTDILAAHVMYLVSELQTTPWRSLLRP